MDLEDQNFIKIFTDGSYHPATKMRRKFGYAGWAFAVYPSGVTIDPENETVSHFGPVITNSNIHGYLGPDKPTNGKNTTPEIGRASCRERV